MYVFFLRVCVSLNMHILIMSISHCLMHIWYYLNSMQSPLLTPTQLCDMWTTHTSEHELTYLQGIYIYIYLYILICKHVLESPFVLYGFCVVDFLVCFISFCYYCFNIYIYIYGYIRGRPIYQHIAGSNITMGRRNRHGMKYNIYIYICVEKWNTYYSNIFS